MAKTSSKKSPQRSTRLIAVLRGINVGGHRKIKMAELRDRLTARGLRNIQTYIQSGNLVFDSATQPSDLELQLHDWILEDFGHQVPTLVRTAKYLQKVVSNNPFAELDLSKLCVTLLSSKPRKKDLTAIESLDFGDDQFVVQGDVVYLHCPNGYARTKLTNGFFETRLNVSATSRNWKTVNRLIQMSQET